MIPYPECSQARAVLFVAGATLAEATRGKLWWLVIGAAVLLTAAGVGLGEFHFGSANLRLVLDLGFGAIGLGGTVLAVIGMAQLYFGELDSRLWQFVLARPVARPAWLAGKLAGVLVVLAVYSGVLTVGLLILVQIVGSGAAMSQVWRDILGGGVLLWLRAAVVSAGTLVVCTYARSAWFASAAAMLGVLVGHLRPAAELWPRDWSVGGMLGRCLRLWPDLQVFEPTESLALDGRVVAYALGYVVLFSTVAVLVFRRREL